MQNKKTRAVDTGSAFNGSINNTAAHIKVPGTTPKPGLRVLNDLGFITGTHIKISDKNNTLFEKYYSQPGNMVNGPGALLNGPGVQMSYKNGNDLPTVDLVNDIIGRAIKYNASDIHIEPLEKYLRVRFRLDGVLHNTINLPIEKKPAFISRLKIMADLDIAEKRRPQDGRIRFAANGKAVDIRVSTLPTDFGEKMVLRILDKGAIDLILENLGFKNRDVALFKRAVELPHGMIFSSEGKTQRHSERKILAGVFPFRRSVKILPRCLPFPKESLALTKLDARSFYLMVLPAAGKRPRFIRL